MSSTDTLVQLLDAPVGARLFDRDGDEWEKPYRAGLRIAGARGVFLFSSGDDVAGLLALAPWRVLAELDAQKASAA